MYIQNEKSAYSKFANIPWLEEVYESDEYACFYYTALPGHSQEETFAAVIKEGIFEDPETLSLQPLAFLEENEEVHLIWKRN